VGVAVILNKLWLFDHERRLGSRLPFLARIPPHVRKAYLIMRLKWRPIFLERKAVPGSPASLQPSIKHLSIGGQSQVAKPWSLDERLFSGFQPASSPVVLLLLAMASMVAPLCGYRPSVNSMVAQR